MATPEECEKAAGNTVGAGGFRTHLTEGPPAAITIDSMYPGGKWRGGDLCALGRSEFLRFALFGRGSERCHRMVSGKSGG